MKEQLKKADLFGLAIIAATLIVYSTRSVWNIYQTIAAVVGGLLVVISFVLRLPDIRFKTSIITGKQVSEEESIQVVETATSEAQEFPAQTSVRSSV